MYGKGISRIGELIDLAVDTDVINKAGAWFSYGETRLGQGRDKVKMLLEENEELAKEIEEKVLANIDHLRETKKMKKGAKVPEITPNIPSPTEKKAAKKEPAKKAPAKADAKLDILVED
jgi:recombination protein RecA